MLKKGLMASLVLLGLVANAAPGKNDCTKEAEKAAIEAHNRKYTEEGGETPEYKHIKVTLLGTTKVGETIFKTLSAVGSEEVLDWLGFTIVFKVEGNKCKYLESVAMEP